MLMLLQLSMPSFLVLSWVVKPGEAVSFRPAHHEYMTTLKSTGKMEAGYRFVDGKGGVYILQAASEDDARRIADADPYHKNGIREYTLTAVEKRY